ncbi:thiaminase II [Actinomycetospora cinnamomea]|uniref:Aminopyrimidine aminohydrolase n=1 Tax=Actinomycetospora cinnamomea TaxID=663609 RepID=A0A2U1FA58_9PSEU|nr:thiaminase II [Actinomycetospora cinnamomea]PVZ09071.1 thiaminase /4-amino-5-aminomethyl-2-methylpyrimidine deaminase [Actinomycetospora cinnamomea]
MGFSDELWTSGAGVYERVREHPFLTGLADGTLPHAAFRHFVVQDAHYLRGFARALALLGARAPGEADTVMFAQHAAGAIAAEQDMHAELADALGLTAEQAAAEPVAPTTTAYTSYLLATCHGGSFAEGLGAVLPCYWIYARVGEALLEGSSPDPLYARWIAMYGGEEFQAVVDAVLALTDRLGPALGDAERERVREHYVTTCRYEWMFWDAAWRQETWPV